MKLVGSGDQHRRDFSVWADGVIASSTLPQLVLPENSSRSSLFFQNTSTAIMWYGFGSARATCTISNGAVNAITLTNAGFGFSRAPRVHFYGGGIIPAMGNLPSNTSYIGGAGPGFPSPQSGASARCIMTGNAPNMKVASIVIDNPGSGYVLAPYILIVNDVLDPNGCFDPSALQNAAAGSGFQLYPGQSIYEAHTVMTTDPLAVFCATATSTFACRWTT